MDKLAGMDRLPAQSLAGPVQQLEQRGLPYSPLARQSPLVSQVDHLPQFLQSHLGIIGIITRLEMPEGCGPASPPLKPWAYPVPCHPSVSSMCKGGVGLHDVHGSFSSVCGEVFVWLKTLRKRYSHPSCSPPIYFICLANTECYLVQDSGD